MFSLICEVTCWSKTVFFFRYSSASTPNTFVIQKKLYLEYNFILFTIYQPLRSGRVNF